VILMIGARTYRASRGEVLLRALVEAARLSDARACVQLDHCDDLETITAALAAGAGAALADGSAMPYEENVAFVQAAISVARERGAAIEAELGGIAGDEDIAEAVAAGALTDPDQAHDMAARTGIDCLAISIGNVHGVYRNPPQLDWTRLEAVNATVAAPLALHGASGLPDMHIRRAITLGVAKVNVNTDLRRAYLDATQAALPAALDGLRLDALHDAQVQRVAEITQQRLAALDTGHAA
jgi:ketose-bisphosphate aldolase